MNQFIYRSITVAIQAHTQKYFKYLRQIFTVFCTYLHKILAEPLLPGGSRNQVLKGIIQFNALHSNAIYIILTNINENIENIITKPSNSEIDSTYTRYNGIFASPEYSISENGKFFQS